MAIIYSYPSLGILTPSSWNVIVYVNASLMYQVKGVPSVVPIPKLFKSSQGNDSRAASIAKELSISSRLLLKYISNQSESIL